MPGKRTSRTRPREPVTPDPSLFGLEIEALRPHPREPDLVRIIIERKAVSTLPVEAAVELGLAEGTPWTEALAERVFSLADEEAARRRGLRILSGRQRSAGELTRSLTRAGHSREAAAKAVERLRAAGLLDDGAYARALAESTLRSKPAGPAFLKAKLRQRGIERDQAETVTREVLADQDLTEMALELARKKARPLVARLDRPTLTRRINAALLRRGFDGTTARHATTTVLDELRPESTTDPDDGLASDDHNRHDPSRFD